MAGYTRRILHGYNLEGKLTQEEKQAVFYDMFHPDDLHCIL